MQQQPQKQCSPSLWLCCLTSVFTTNCKGVWLLMKTTVFAGVVGWFTKLRTRRIGSAMNMAELLFASYITVSSLAVVAETNKEWIRHFSQGTRRMADFKNKPLWWLRKAAALNKDDEEVKEDMYLLLAKVVKRVKTIEIKTKKRRNRKKNLSAIAYHIFFLVKQLN